MIDNKNVAADSFQRAAARSSNNDKITTTIDKKLVLNDNDVGRTTTGSGSRRRRNRNRRFDNNQSQNQNQNQNRNQLDHVERDSAGEQNRLAEEVGLAKCRVEENLYLDFDEYKHYSCSHCYK